MTNGRGTAEHSTEWRGRFFEDFVVGAVYRSRLGRTLTETDNIRFTTLTMVRTRSTSTMHTRGERSLAGRSSSGYSHAGRCSRTIGRGHERERRGQSRLGEHQTAKTRLCW